MDTEKKIIWVASYPKSGNTWIRSFLSSYFFTDNGSFNFDLLKSIPTFESDIFSHYISKEQAAKNPYEISNYWINVQKELKLEKGDFIFLKTHNFCGKINNNPFTSSEYTHAFIYVVRDPREVVVSLSNHANQSLQKSLEMVTSSEPVYLIDEGENYPVYIYNWGVNYYSWKSFNSVPNIIVKYEDLHKNPKKYFGEIIHFLSKIGAAKFDQNKFNKSINSTSFKKVSLLEDKYGFKEIKTQNNKKFFSQGKMDSWKLILSANQRKLIEDKYKKEMIELGYIKND